MTSNDSGNDLRSRIARPGIATLLLIGLIAMALVGAGCGGDDTADTGTEGGATAAQTEPTGEKAEEAEGEVDSKSKETFASTCGGCHTLADAGTSGTTGPNLDDLKPDAARVEAAIKNGGASGTTMPKNLLEGEEAAAVAAYVASVAGK